MLDIQLFRDNPDRVREGLAKRHQDTSAVNRVVELDQQRRNLIQQVESLRAEKNQASKDISKTKDPDQRE
ncbi:MAG: serine--tRNA ligase, partial [Anaerolineales bacterium]